MTGTTSFLDPKSLLAVLFAVLSGTASAQTPRPGPETDILGLKLNMTVAETVSALQAIGKGRITYHYAEPRFIDGKCVLEQDRRYTAWAGSYTSPKLGERDGRVRAYSLTPVGDHAPKAQRCPTFLTDITFLDLVEQDEKRPFATKLFTSGDKGPKFGPVCDYFEIAGTGNLQGFLISGRMTGGNTIAPLPPQITACEAIRIAMSPVAGEERSALISRVKVYRSDHPAFDTISKGLETKYGPAPTYTTDETKETFRALARRWTFDTSGKLVSSKRGSEIGACTSSLNEPRDEMTPPVTTGITSDCAVSVLTRISSLRENPYLVRSLSVTMLNDSTLFRLLGEREALARTFNDDAAKAQAAGASGKAEKF